MHSLLAFGSEKGCLRFTAAKIGVLGRAMSAEAAPLGDSKLLQGRFCSIR
jgi:hypothetical protein